MSHFTVAVFHRPDQDIEELLAPYNEQDEAYMEFEQASETEAQLNAAYKKNKRGYKSFKDFMKGYYGYCQNNEGKWGYMTNPNAKWDWYQVVGRLSGFFRLRTGGTTDVARVSEIDFAPDPIKYQKALRWWEVCVDDQPLEPGENRNDFFSLYKKEYYIDQYGTKERYAADQATPIPWACVTADGEWKEDGQMGWWALSDATQESRNSFRDWFMQYIKNNLALMVTMVDCHI